MLLIEMPLAHDVLLYVYSVAFSFGVTCSYEYEGCVVPNAALPGISGEHTTQGGRAVNHTISSISGLVFECFPLWYMGD